MENELISKFYNINKELYQSAKNPMRSHDYNHHLRVCRYALDLADKVAKKRKVEIDREILIIACFFHDVAAFFPDEFSKNDQNIDALLAEKELRKINLPEEKIKKVTDAIRAHGSDPSVREADEHIEVSLLRDADKLEVFGPLGITRVIMARTRRGDGIAEMVEDFYTKGHLKKKWDSITSDEARKIGKEGYEYAMDFFKKLAEAIKNK